jgi:alpha/beta superfamily hydrolase
MAPGFTGTRDLICYAKAFARAGLAVLPFDYRHFGESEGSPRQIVGIGKQMEHWRSAIAMARTLDRVDSKRIALWRVHCPAVT